MDKLKYMILIWSMCILVAFGCTASPSPTPHGPTPSTVSSPTRIPLTPSPTNVPLTPTPDVTATHEFDLTATAAQFATNVAQNLATNQAKAAVSTFQPLGVSENAHPSPTPISASGDKRLAFERWIVRPDLYPEYPHYDRTLYLSNLDGSHRYPVNADLAGSSGRFEWSPKGTWFLFFQNFPSTSRGEDVDLDLQFWPAEAWIIRPDGTQRTRLFEFTAFQATSGWFDTVRRNSWWDWSADEQFLIILCPMTRADYQICLIDLKTGGLVRTSNAGLQPQISPDGTHYAWMNLDKTAIFSAAVSDHQPQLVYETPFDWLTGFSWDREGLSILTAESGYGEPGLQVFCNGSSNILEINISSKETQVLMSIDQTMYAWSLSHTQELLLTDMASCRGNVYFFRGIINLATFAIKWPFNNKDDMYFAWTTDGEYLEGTLLYYIVDRRLFDPYTSREIEFGLPTWITEEVTEEEWDHGIFIYWMLQP